ncbi:MAG: fumarylacetoacetate hydrolase family protein [Deltaproteobacteria bacterium]|nr:fumarylacetoacetate hydrolase family protein [Deltaproteobacteria bacterium]
MAHKFPWRLVSFRLEKEGPETAHVGIWEGDRMIDLSAALVASGRPRPEGMRQLLEWYAAEDFVPWMTDTVRKGATTYPIDQAILLAPITNPRMFYDFLGFEQHVRQIRARRGTTVPELWYKRPAYYIGSVAPDKLFGPGAVTIPNFVEKSDYECELALVIGKAGQFTVAAEAAKFIQQHCFFTLCNDWSARDYQKLDMELGLGVSHSKTIIGTSFGPALVHASQFRFNADGCPDLTLQVVVNGMARGEANYQSAYWDFAKILAFLGREKIGVFPGDIIGSGTIGNGCIAEFAAKVVDGKEVEPARFPWLQSGDKVTLTADGIGTLANTVQIIRHQT